MAKYANLTMSVALSSGGRPVTITRTPFSGQSYSNTSPPAALSTSTQAIFTRQQLQAGNNQITLPQSYLTGFQGPFYWILIPPSTSTNSKALRGAPTDTGWALVPNIPLVYAFPVVGVTPSIYIWSLAAELCDSVFI